MALRTRLIVTFAAILTGVLIAGIASALVITARDDAQAASRRLSIAAEQSTRLTVAYLDQETGARGFALSRNSTLLAPYRNGRAAERRLTRSIRSLAGQRQGVAADLDDVIARARAWRTGSVRPEINQVRAGGPALTPAEVEQGKFAFDRLRGSLARLSSSIGEEASRASSHAADLRRWLAVLQFGVIVGLAGTAIVVGWLARRWVTRPLAALGAQVRTVRAGADDQPIRIAGPPEIASLAADVEQMRRRIEQQRHDAERSQLAVEQSAAVVLELRSQLEPEVGQLPRGWSVAGRIHGAEGVVAGDCFDVFSIDDRSLALVVVDIAGHGAVEGILALRCKELLRASLVAGVEPGDALVTVAGQLDDLGPESFLTAFVGAIDTTSGDVRYANAGHPPAFICGPDDISELPPTGPLLGLLTPGWRTADAQLPSGSALCAYTDGLIEARDVSGAFYGPERLAELVATSRCEDAPRIVEQCLAEVEAWSAGLGDDATVVVLCRPEIV